MATLTSWRLVGLQGFYAILVTASHFTCGGQVVSGNPYQDPRTNGAVVIDCPTHHNN
jgi:hypothetical protein